MKTRSRTLAIPPAGSLWRAVLFLSLLGGLAPLARGWEGTFFDLFEISNSARAAAMGGLHCALADDSSTLFSNPAGLRSVDRELKISEVTLGLYESALEIASETFSGLAGPATDRRATFSLWGPLAFTYVGKGRGFGIFSSTNAFVHAWGPSPLADVVMEDNLVLIGAWAFRIPLGERSTLDLGFSLVGFATLRGYYNFDVRQLFQSTATYQDMVAASGAFQRALGAGLDVGVLYSFDKLFSVGLSGRNLAITQTRDYPTIMDFLGGGSSTAWYIALPMDITAGIMFRPPLGRLSRLFSDLLFAADYHDIFDFLIYPAGATNPLLHIGVGLELELLKIVSLRAGYYQCLPSFGIGLDLTLFKLNLAYFGRELSAEPGGYPVGCYTVGLEFAY